MTRRELAQSFFSIDRAVLRDLSEGGPIMTIKRHVMTRPSCGNVTILLHQLIKI